MAPIDHFMLLNTFGLDKFWSGVAGRTKRGLEISLVCIINVGTGKAWSLDVRQTPSGLSSKEGEGQDYTRIDFYLEQLMDCFVQLPQILYYTADGYYSKKSFGCPHCPKQALDW